MYKYNSFKSSTEIKAEAISIAVLLGAGVIAVILSWFGVLPL